MSQKYRVAIIGSTGRGNYGHGIDVVWKDFPDQVEVVAIADPNEAGRIKAQAQTGASRAYVDYHEMLEREKPQIVAVGPRWVDQHADMVIAAAQHGCHVYMEKPLCRTLEEADRMVAACEKAKVQLAIAHISRYSPLISVAQKIIADGLLGNLLEMRARGKEDHKRGGIEDLWVLGSHLMNLMTVFAGEPLTCSASLKNQNHPMTASDLVEGGEGLGPMGADAVHARYEFAKGVTGDFASVRGQAGNPWRFAIQLFGSKGILEIPSGYLEPVYFLADPSWSPNRSGKKWETVSSAGVGVPEPRKDRGNHFGNVAAVKDLLLAIQEQREPLCGVHAARTTIEMIMAVFESHRQGGGPVKFPLQERRHPLTLLKQS